MSRLRIHGARVLDPASGRDERLDVDVEDGRIQAVGADLPGTTLDVALGSDKAEEAQG